ncbi:MAG: lipoyl(octanoyl) transferase LipB [Bdellovibrionales bacterium]|nr:lipoyl(octanoyl) transferase LipB [Bdellovibrionales bacterium]
MQQPESDFSPALVGPTPIADPQASPVGQTLHAGSVALLSIPGVSRYREILDLQHRLVERRLAGEIGDTVLMVEHHPVVTRGRGLQFTGVARERSIPMAPLPAGVDFHEIERGGDLTYHGPGQLVIYPIIHLEGRDVGAYIRRLEAAVIQTLRDFGLETSTRTNATGVWTADERKIASVGIAVRRWVTFHGIGLNVVNDLSAFQMISPCGFSPEVMTSLKVQGSDWEGLNPTNWSTLRSQIEASFMDAWNKTTPGGWLES